MVSLCKSIPRILRLVAGICAIFLVTGWGVGSAFAADTPQAAIGSNTGATPAKLKDGWPVNSLSSAGFDPAAMARLTQSIKNGDYPNTHAVLVEHAGRGPME